MAKYRMTPKRRAALVKAQKASARKRKRSRNRKLLIGGATAATVFGIGTAAYLGRDYISTVARGGPRQSKTPRFDAYMALPKQLALPPGKGSRKTVFKTPRQPPIRRGAFRVNPSGEASYVRRPRGAYDAARRAGDVNGYGKKVRGVPYKDPITGKRRKYAMKTSDGVGMSARTQRRRNKKRG